MNSTPITWLDIVKISVSSGLLTSISTWGLNHFFVQRSAFQRDARYLAQRIAMILERFAIDCSECIEEATLYNDSGGHAGKRQFSLPPLGHLPEDADWKALPSDLTDRILSMPNAIFLAEKKISFWWDVLADEDAVAKETMDQAGGFGMESWNLAKDLRRRCKIPPSSLPDRLWNFVDTLDKQLKKTKARQKNHEKAAAD